MPFFERSQTIKQVTTVRPGKYPGPRKGAPGWQERVREPSRAEVLKVRTLDQQHQHLREPASDANSALPSRTH